MLERSITALQVIDPGEADQAALRERLKAGFPAGAARRMTLLGMMVGSALQQVAREDADALVYASEFGESLSLENYLCSFPTASPTLFQTSIHPSGFQQGLILRQRSMRDVIPIAGGPELVLQSALAAMTNPASVVLWAGGDERGTWLRELGAAADRSFAFALVLGKDSQGACGHLRLEPSGSSGRISLAEWFDLLRSRRGFTGPIGSGWQLTLRWM